MTYDEVISDIREGSIITYKEYTLDRHERKRETLEIEGAVVQRVFNSNEKLDRATLEKYYGYGLSDIEYLQLSQMNCPRIVLGLGLNTKGELEVKIILLNRDYYNLGLQVLEVTNALESGITETEPNYFEFQRHMQLPWHEV